jgi:hypothetical protein
MKTALSYLLIAGAILASFPVAAEAAQARRVILVPAFAGPGEIGVRTANVLALQISRSFRATDGRNGEPFGRGVLFWDHVPLPVMNYEDAIRRALNIGTLAHLVLWGRAYEAGDDVVAQAYLTVTPILYELTKQRRELWTVRYRARDAAIIELTADLPSNHFTFAPAVLDRAAVAKYRSIPALDIFSDKSFRHRVGRIGNNFRAVKYEPEAVYLRSNKAQGWVPLPFLSDDETVITLFTSATFQLMRGDFALAVDLFARVLATPGLPTPLRIDTLLLRGLAQEKLGRSGLETIREAHGLNIYRAGSCRYLLQALVDAIAKKNPERAKRIQELRSAATACGPLFPQEDGWWQNVQRIVADLAT